MLWLWAALAVLACIAGLRHWMRIRSNAHSTRPPRVDDDAVRRILNDGSLGDDADESLDMDAAARAEEEFWSESWDEPEEYSR
jgi:hypothetical protein